jgi:hypothetical protein
MDNRSAVQNLWRAARGGLARINQILAEAETSEDVVFQTQPKSDRTSDAERRIANARKDGPEAKRARIELR